MSVPAEASTADEAHMTIPTANDSCRTEMFLGLFWLPLVSRSAVMIPIAPNLPELSEEQIVVLCYMFGRQGW